MMSDKPLDPIRLGKTELKIRIIMAPPTRLRAQNNVANLGSMAQHYRDHTTAG
jgi:2,4-dienoyl-CoA reductase-like NADH-dependent reductase (Old Yellow Enzyme family)